MHYYLLESMAPLVFRSGKPFGSQADVKDVAFPLPSSAAGLMRTQHIQQTGIALNDGSHGMRGKLSPTDLANVQAIGSHGPYLVCFDDAKQKSMTVLLPKPADALYVQENDKTTLQRLSPRAIIDTGRMGCDLPDGLLPVQMDNGHIKGKPKGGPAFWSFEHVQQWQNHLKPDLTFEDIQAQGLNALPIELRTHVKLHDDKLSAQEGQLFQTASFDLQASAVGRYEGWQSKRYGFLIVSEAQLKPDLARFGGEGRLAAFRQHSQVDIFKAKTNLAKDIQGQKGLRLTLCTPAIFAKGFLPAWLDEKTLIGTLPSTSISVRLRAAAIERWLPVSGWDLQQYAPKAMRKAVAAGAVYWFELLSENADGIEALAFSSISDHPQDQKDGFGIVNIAPWQAV